MRVSRVADSIALGLKLGLWRSALYASHRVKLASGWYRVRQPVAPWTDLPDATIHSARSIFATPDRELVRKTMHRPEGAVEAGERILRGELRYFSHQWMKRPPDWSTSPATGKAGAEDHWSGLSDFDKERGDIKWVWEASRFDWAYQLARAWVASDDARFPEGFWTLFASWRDENPPNHGAAWKCGQECSVRLFALVWAAAAFAEAKESTPDRVAALWSTVSALATRVEASIGYALAQNNNHGLAEATALYVAGCCLPAHGAADRWRRRGKRLFERQVLEQFAPDGSYNHHSMNYQRFALRIAFVAARCAAERDDALRPEVLARLRAAVSFLDRFRFGTEGELPNYGANDGANLLALSSADYTDFRPVLQACHFQWNGRRLYPPGAHDEELAWHFGPGPWPEPSAPEHPPVFRADAGGYYALRSTGSQALIRCHTFRNRPGHADMLHLDLWMGGANVLVDSGSYRYFDPNDWGRHFKSTAAHNTVTVDGLDQMRPFGRFLWADWTRSRVLGAEAGSGGAVHFSGEHEGYERLGVVHRRSVQARDDEWLVVDDMFFDEEDPAAPHDFTLRWHLAGAGDWRMMTPDATRILVTSESLGLRLVVASEPDDDAALSSGEDGFPQTAMSLYYGSLSPIALLEVRRTSGRSFRWATAVGRIADLESGSSLRWHGAPVDRWPFES